MKPVPSSRVMTDDDLARFENRLCREGKRLTAVRREVLRAMVTANAPRTAYGLLETINKTREPKLSPISLYRALAFLTEAGVVLKLESHNAFALCHTATADHHHVVLVCDTCGQTREVHDAALTKAFTHTAGKNGHALDHAVIELHGTCRGCH